MSIHNEVPSYQLFINGDWTDAREGGTSIVYEAARNRPMARVAQATLADVDYAVQSAREALPWAVATYCTK